ncbi:hypothetical protein PLUTE_a5306 [Pseudoalteromonas luteoviolacea DSM 6061]|nr:hypothetical protein [Pseudoalteromonas luteoviolacea DSM 6061]
MNGRIFDADTGRFMQADPFVQAPTNLQNYNAYSYVLNNPLSYTDPSGYFFKKLAGTLLSRKGAQLVGFSLGGLTGAWLGGRAYDRIMGSEGLQTVVAVALNFVPGCQVWCSALFSAQVNYYHTGNVGSALRAGTTSAAIAGVFYGIGQGAVALDAVGSPLHISAHAVAGGIIADVQGGNFGHGFWSAGLTKAVNVNSFMPGDGTLMDIARTIVAGAIGGTISQLTGGKFANGAITAAYAQAYNGNNELKKAAKTPQQSHASGEYATDNGGQIKYLQSSDVAGVQSLTDSEGNSYYVNSETGVAELVFEAGNGAANSVCLECFIFGGGTINAIRNGRHLFFGAGLFGKNGLRVGNIRIDALYQNGSGVGGTLISIKGSYIRIRFDYGRLHKGGVGWHSTIRVRYGNWQFGNTRQRTWYPPFKRID